MREFLELLRRPNAEQEFIDLFRQGASGARLYALCGLLALNSTKVGAYREAMKGDNRGVGVMNGCLFSATTSGEFSATPQYQEMCDELVMFSREP